MDFQQCPKIGKVLGGIKGKITGLKTFDANEEEGTNIVDGNNNVDLMEWWKLLDITQCLQGSKVGNKEQQIGKIKECVVRAQVQAIVDMVTSTPCKAKVLEYQFAFLFIMLDNGNLSTQALKYLSFCHNGKLAKKVTNVPNAIINATNVNVIV